MSRLRNLTPVLATLMLAGPVLHSADLATIGDTKLRIYGFLQIYGYEFFNAFQTPGSEASSLFYQDPANGGSSTILNTSNQPDKNFQFGIAPSRFGLASTTPSASLGDIHTKIEFDLNGSNDHLRLANIQIGGWTAGKAWSLWNDMDAGANTVDWAGPIGSACFDTPRMLLLMYVAKLDKNNSLGISLEQNSGYSDGTTFTSASPTTTGDAKIPTLVVAYTYADTWGHLALRGLAQDYGVYVPYAPATAGGVYSVNPKSGAITASAPTAATPEYRFSSMESAGMLSGDVKFGKDDLVFSLYYGNALGQYGTGFQAVLIDATSNEAIYPYKNVGWLAGYTHNWTDKVRSNVVLSGVNYSSNDSIPTTTGAGASDIKTAYSGFLNTFVKLSKNCEVGMEYVYESARAFGTNQAVSQDGSPDNSNIARKLEVEMHVDF
jgi:hypothetical protein